MTIWPATTEEKPLTSRPEISLAPDEDGTQAIIERAIRGEHEPINHIITAYHALIYDLCLKMLRSHDQALDASQDTFVKVYLHITTDFDGTNLGGWISRIAINVCRDKIRRWKNEPLVSDNIVLGFIESHYFWLDPETTLIRQEDWYEIEEILSLMPELNRQALILYHVMGFLYDDLEQILGTNKNNIKQVLHRAKLQFRAAARKAGKYS